MASVARTFILKEDMNAQALWAFLRQNWKAMAAAGKPLAARRKAIENRAANVREYLKAGDDVPGAHLERGQRLEIK